MSCAFTPFTPSVTQPLPHFAIFSPDEWWSTRFSRKTRFQRILLFLVHCLSRRRDISLTKSERSNANFHFCMRSLLDTLLVILVRPLLLSFCSTGSDSDCLSCCRKRKKSECKNDAFASHVCERCLFRDSVI